MNWSIKTKHDCVEAVNLLRENLCENAHATNYKHDVTKISKKKGHQ